MGERVKELQKRAKLLEAMLKLHQVKKKLQGVGVDEIEKLRAVDANIKGIETPLECLSDTSASESDSKSDVESRGSFEDRGSEISLFLVLNKYTVGLYPEPLHTGSVIIPRARSAIVQSEIRDAFTT
jgi:hypothetical protein